MEHQVVMVKPNGYWACYGIYETKEEALKAVDEFNEHRSKDGQEYFYWERGQSCA